MKPDPIDPLKTRVQAKKVRVLIDAHVIADMGTSRYNDTETYAKELESDCRDFISHCKDHRSLDHIGLQVERVYETQCSACERTFEAMNNPDVNEGRTSCAECGTEMES